MLYDWRNRTVLIAEDDDMSFRYLQLVLSRKTNINIIWAINGQQAVDFCKLYDHIDLVIMDLQLPVIDGFEAIKRIKAFKPHLPIIVHTANVLNDEWERCASAGCDDYITKPVDLNEFFSRINNFLNPVHSDS